MINEKAEVSGVDYSQLFKSVSSVKPKDYEDAVSRIGNLTQIFGDALALSRISSLSDYENLEKRLSNHLLVFKTPYDGKAGANYLANEVQDAVGYVNYLATTFGVDKEKVARLKKRLYGILIEKVPRATWMYVPEKDMAVFKGAELLHNFRKI